ncbi:MAG: DUF3135 domain-containing protein [Candidatus Magasanikbacteria bacterium]|nr:DUF3135 domain-containing protein [Candidatus Magasanikbacteria bacterium]
MPSEFIEKRLEGMKTTIPGYDFYELAKLAKENPQEFERRRKQFLEAELAKSPEDCREKDSEFLGRLLQSRDPSMDIDESIVRSMIAPLQGIGDLNHASRDCVTLGARSIDGNMDSIKKASEEAGKVKEEILSSFNSIVGDLNSTARSIEESIEGINKIEIGVAQIEANQIPNKNKQ